MPVLRQQNRMKRHTESSVDRCGENLFSILKQRTVVALWVDWLPRLLTIAEPA
jgi:hypothetical protein